MELKPIFNIFYKYKETDSLIKCIRLKSYCEQPRIHEILHIKCPIIRLIRCQMDHMDNRLSDAFNICNRFGISEYSVCPKGS
ncbi:hypothetical protein NQ314_002989 [Rhamnusium bicolor]|uniref:Uncharacterized protein n=1 Tax=Rhamnusium bicolor TaxID=1586634 RepID=A0AAV8ZP45_9CUCU|nr:hypothetical protein NQ314_002989 [Rhamnusium bicolor]